MISDEEISALSQLAEERGIPLLIDNAYGSPFPNILFKEITPFWNQNVVLGMSLSKLGLPSARVGIIIANHKIIQAITSCNTIISLSNGAIGQVLTEPMFKSGLISQLSETVIKPFYLQKRDRIEALVAEVFSARIFYRIHQCDGGFFLWIWFPLINISTVELYTRLKKRKVLIVPGHYFFFGLDEGWDHGEKCIRINYSIDEKIIIKGLKIMCEEVEKAQRE